MRVIRTISATITVCLGLMLVSAPTVQATDSNRVLIAAAADPVSKKDPKKTSVVEYVNDAYAYLAGIGGLLAIIMLIYAGYSYMTSYGDPEKLSNAKDIIEKALIGLALLILAAVILNTINPRTTDPRRCPAGDKTCVDFTKPGG